jgi:hypothetical protein
LNKVDPDKTHIPLRNSAINEKIAVFFRFEPSRVDLTDRMKNIIISAIWNNNPLNTGRPRTFTKKRSNFEEIMTTPGLMPYIRRARIIRELAIAVKKPFQENLNFLK